MVDPNDTNEAEVVFSGINEGALEMDNLTKTVPSNSNERPVETEVSSGLNETTAQINDLTIKKGDSEGTQQLM